MAIVPIFAESFDHYVDADLTQKWSQREAGGLGAIDVGAYGRRSSQGIRLRTTSGSNNSNSGRIRRVCAFPTPVGARCIIGVAFKPVSAFNVSGSDNTNDASSQCIMAIWSGGVVNHWLRLNSNGTLAVLRGSTVLGTSASALTVNTFYYLDLDVYIHDSAGTVDLYIDGVSTLSLTSQDTKNGATATWNEIILGPTYNFLGSGTLEWHMDDVYVLDGAVGDTGQALHDVRVDALRPTAEGTTINFAPSTGTDNSANVDDTLADGDSTYNSTATVGHKDTFVVQDAPVVGGTISFVQIAIQGRKSDAGSAGIKTVVRSDGADYLSAEQAMASSNTIRTSIWHKDPDGDVTWTEAAFNAAEFGYSKSV